MKRIAAFIAGLSFLLMSAFASVAICAELDEHLRFFEPLIGVDWEGGYIGEDAPDLVLTLRFEPNLQGKSVLYSRAATALGFFSETHFYWDPSRREVLYVQLNSRGIVGEGVASLEGGDIVLLGVSHWPESTIETKTVLHIDSTGVLRDTFTRKENGEWVPGHVQEFAAKE